VIGVAAARIFATGKLFHYVRRGAIFRAIRETVPDHEFVNTGE